MAGRDSLGSGRARSASVFVWALGMLAAWLATLGAGHALGAAKEPNLAVSKLGATPAKAAPGGKLKVKDTTVNQGKAKAGPSKTAYLLSKDKKPSKRDI